MPRILNLVAVVLAAGVACAQDQVPANGLYNVVSSDGVAVKTLDGSEIRLGERLSQTVVGARLVSNRNDNEGYSLRFHLTPNVGRAALYVDGFCVSFRTSQGALNDVTVTSSAAAQAFARYLGVEPRLREHPGYALETRFVPTRAAFSSDEPVIVTLKIENVGHVPVTFVAGGRQRGARDNQFGFTAFGPFGAPVPDTGDPQNVGGIGSIITLAPAETFRKEVDLRKWFAFTQLGVYRLKGTYDLDFSDSPGDLGLTKIWTDVAAASFSVTIK